VVVSSFGLLAFILSMDKEFLNSLVISKEVNLEKSEVGIVLSVGDGVAIISGLNEIKSGEMLEFKGGFKGLALNLNKFTIGAVILGDERLIKPGDVVQRTNLLMNVPVGEGLLGRVVDALGNPVDGQGALINTSLQNIEVKAPGVIDRKSVHEPMLTGIKTVDSLLPIGRGQRELIIGDRQTGKTAIALDAIINQKNLKDSFFVFMLLWDKNVQVWGKL